jgi:hypothetical protein
MGNFPVHHRRVTNATEAETASKRGAASKKYSQMCSEYMHASTKFIAQQGDMFIKGVQVRNISRLHEVIETVPVIS